MCICTYGPISTYYIYTFPTSLVNPGSEASRRCASERVRVRAPEEPKSRFTGRNRPGMIRVTSAQHPRSR